jgi:hypothetical protein
VSTPDSTRDAVTSEMARKPKQCVYVDQRDWVFTQANLAGHITRPAVGKSTDGPFPADWSGEGRARPDRSKFARDHKPGGGDVSKLKLAASWTAAAVGF